MGLGPGAFAIGGGGGGGGGAAGAPGAAGGPCGGCAAGGGGAACAGGAPLGGYHGPCTGGGGSPIATHGAGGGVALELVAKPLFACSNHHCATAAALEGVGEEEEPPTPTPPTPTPSISSFTSHSSNFTSSFSSSCRQEQMIWDLNTSLTFDFIPLNDILVYIHFIPFTAVLATTLKKQ